MAVRKTAISLPPELLEDLDRSARRHKVTRSRYVAGAVRAAIERERREAIRRRIDEVFSDPSVARSQITTAERALATAADWWKDEKW